MMESQNNCPNCGKPLETNALQGLCPECLIKAGWPTVDKTEPNDEAGGFVPPSIDDLATLFPQLEILELIGRGGMGAVYKARQPNLDRIVALKILAKKAGSDPGFTERFTREARALAKLSHPSIVAVYDFGHTSSDLSYFIMEYVDGLNLRQIEQAGQLSPREALEIIPKICEALQFAHDKGVVHRDIKPENVLLDQSGCVKIADFGLAKIMGTESGDFTLTEPNQVMGTPHYMAPEQVEHPRDVDHRADIYSLGVVFYEMLTGELPLGKFAPPSRKVQMDVRLDEVVLRTLEKEPELRYQQVSQVRTDVQTIASTPQPQVQGEVSSHLPKQSLSYISTPEYLRTFRGRFLSIYQGKGELRLDSESLSFRRGWQAVTIPLSSISVLAQGTFPTTAKPLPLHYIAVTFEEHGLSRTLLFTPVRTEVMSPTEANKIGAEWMSHLTKAIRARTGRTLSVGHLDVTQKTSWWEYVKLYLFLAATSIPGFSLIPIILKHRLPNRLIEFLPGPIFAIPMFFMVLTMPRWLGWFTGRGRRQQPEGKASQSEHQPSGLDFWQKIMRLLILLFLGLVLLAAGLLTVSAVLPWLHRVKFSAVHQFGPTVERSFYEPEANSPEIIFWDLDRDIIMSPPFVLAIPEDKQLFQWLGSTSLQSNARLNQWIEDMGVDLALTFSWGEDLNSGSWYFMGLGAERLNSRFDESPFDRFKPADLFERTTCALRVGGKQIHPGRPSALCIKTDQGKVGVLEYDGLFDGVTDGFKIRYKLLERRPGKRDGTANKISPAADVEDARSLILPALRSASAEQMEENWPSFRGPGGAGIGIHANVPTRWDGTTGEGILWKSPIPLSGCSSPILWENRIFVSGGTDDRLEVYGYDADSGKPLWTGSVPMTRPPAGKDLDIPEDTGMAAPTMVTDGSRVFAIFATGDIGCFDFSGQKIWTRSLGIPDNVYGHASSLAVSGGVVIVQSDQGKAEDGRSRLIALDVVSGDIVWQTKRPVRNSWSSPIVVRIDGRDTIITCADPWVIAYDAAAGTELWRVKCLKGDVAASACYANGRVYVTEPYGKLIAINVDGRGDVTDSHIVWTVDDVGPDVCTPLSNGQWVIILGSDGIIGCYGAQDGVKLWEEALDAEFMASPSLVGDTLYLLSRKGTMFIAQVGSEFKLIGQCRLDEKCVASPAFTEGRVYIRGEKNLYCIVDTRSTETSASMMSPDSVTPLTGELVTFDGVPADLPGSWTGFRGGNGDGISDDPIPLARTWPAEGPPVRWSIDLGEGYAGAAVHHGRVYIMDYNSPIQADVIRCVSLADGRDIWQYRYPVHIKRNHGMSRTVPVVTDKYVVTIGPKCHVTCLNAVTGEFKWALDLVSDFHAKIPPWYAGQCPLIDRDRVILAVGGDALLMSVDCETGRIVWRSTNPNGWTMTHASIVPLEFEGTRQYIYCGSGGVVGVNAENGQILWEYLDWKVTVANIASPVAIGQGRLFLQGGYKVGSLMLQLKKQAGHITAESVFQLDSEIYGPSPHTPILYQGHIYGIRTDGQMTCLDLEGNTTWESGIAHRFGLGPYVIANGLLYVMDDDGRLTLAEATPAGYIQLAQAKVLKGPDAWAPMAVVSGRLILRDLNEMKCLMIGEAALAAR